MTISIEMNGARRNAPDTLPQTGAHTDMLLAGLGFVQDAVARLRESGSVA